ncbi:Gfo/Idh/MocA family protein [Aureliella helgolandensis]|uniref:1,5-anhydro-D-fructose reductase n=1 Tax=Aureliella helgolandensis TaxID=2527968 RepID=A0A518G814_9BACT|nr:Gfo/Idh/MocA family oxidoreductase [Aureliella helgolandensis]QDV24724.1 1,5-anhydro-D-fructose reductase [Aureliella helgolandensis]
MITHATRFGLIGAGAIAQSYLLAFEKSKDAQLVGVTDISLEAATAMAERAHCSAFSDYLAMIEETDCEAVVLCTPPVTHPEITCELLKRNIHVLCEKPLAVGLSEAKLMLAAAEESTAILTMASKFRYSSDIVAAKSLIASGVIGDVVLFENAFTARVDMSHRWNSDPSISGGGVLIDNGTHSVDITRYFLGPIAEIRVVEGLRIQDIAVEDTVQIFVRSASGVMGSIDLSWSLNKELDNYVSIYGSAGTLHVGWKESKYRRAEDEQWTIFGNGYNKVDAFTNQLNDFVTSIRSGELPRISLQDALASVEVIDACYNAMWESSWSQVGSELSESVGFQ